MRKGKHMSKKTKQVNKDSVVDNTPATDVNVTVPTEDQATKDSELVMEAKINLTEDKPSEDVKPTPAEEDKPAPKDTIARSTAVLMNRSNNYICLYATNEIQLTLAPREIRKVDKDLLKELLKNPMVRRFFDKGVVSHDADEDAKVISAHDAVAPVNLTEAVERHEGGNNIVAEVKKFEKDGSFNIDLG